MLKIDKKERERILRLHESKNSKNLLSEQGSADRFVDNQAQQNLQNANNTTTSTSSKPRLSSDEVQQLLTKAYAGPGTNVKIAKDAFSRIPSPQFDKVIEYLMRTDIYIGSYNGLVDALNGEYGARNLNDLIDLNRIFSENNSKYMLKWKTGGLFGKKVSNIEIVLRSENNSSQDTNTTENGWPSDLSCVSSYPDAQQITLKDGSIAYKINNEFYYNTKRKKDQNGTMVNYSCNDEIFRQSSGQQNTGGTTTNTGGSSSGNLTKQIQKTLGIPETGKMDQETINKAYDAVSKR